MPVTEHRVYEACIKHLSERGYVSLTLEALAVESGTPLPVLVDRWGNKQTVVVEAVGRLIKPGPDDTDTGGLRTDLVLQATIFADSIANQSAQLLGSMIEVHRVDPVVCDRLEEYAGDHGTVLPSAVVDRARLRGELAPDSVVSAYDDIVPRVIVARRVSHQVVDAAFIEELVDTVVLPAYERGAYSVS